MGQMNKRQIYMREFKKKRKKKEIQLCWIGTIRGILYVQGKEKKKYSKNEMIKVWQNKMWMGSCCSAISTKGKGCPTLMDSFPPPDLLSPQGGPVPFWASLPDGPAFFFFFFFSVLLADKEKYLIFLLLRESIYCVLVCVEPCPLNKKKRNSCTFVCMNLELHAFLIKS